MKSIIGLILVAFLVSLFMACAPSQPTQVAESDRKAWVVLETDDSRVWYSNAPRGECYLAESKSTGDLSLSCF